MPLGWTSEQKAGIRRWWQIGTIFTMIGVLLGVILIVNGNAGGWGLLVLLLAVWGAATYWLRTARRSQP